ncbi:uncharacterized protein LOC110465193 isoform X2 [Mizuhopecten yessoensis]|uniref:uncharacterized protein LOC110465193 isoform X2 n=1 Tax=Mizuhopecten yessoensis TaxID=6573 RepID=UPI000B45E084|nr:uncharacterized protein LOC110465193 isoform X2 [Mizuhopecten yessoensis]
MEGHTLFVQLLCTICFAINARCTVQQQLTTGMECSVKNQKLCPVNPKTDQENRVQHCQCFFTINVCLTSDHSVTFSYVPPQAKYGIVEGDVFLNKYVGQNNDKSDHFTISLSSKKPCRFKDVVPGEYNILMRPIEPEDFDYYTNDICDCVSTNFASDKFVLKANNTNLLAIYPNNNITVSTSYTRSDEVTTTKPTDTLWDNDNTSGEAESTSGVITAYHATSGVTGAHFANNNSGLDTTFTDKQTHTGHNGLTTTQVIIIITVISSSLVLVPLSVMLIVRNRYHYCCSPHEVAVIKHNQDDAKQREEHEKGEGTNKAEMCDSGINDWETDGFLQSDVATLRERCGPTFVENGQDPAIPFEIYEYTKSGKRCQDPSIYPAVTILSGTLESTNYVHPLFEDIVRDSGHHGCSWVPSSDSSANLDLSRNVYMNQNNKQTSDTTPSIQNQAKYESVINTNRLLSQRDEKYLRHVSPKNQVSVRKGRDNISQILHNQLEFIPPDSIQSECYDITSRTIEQGMLEINGNYFRNISSIFIDGSHDTSIYTGNNCVPTSCHDQNMEVDMAQDSSDISISGISL